MKVTNFNNYKKRYKRRNNYKKNNSYFTDAMGLGVFILLWGFYSKVIKTEYLVVIGMIIFSAVLFKAATYIIKQRNYRHLSSEQIDILSGKNFEKYLRSNFQKQGYVVKLTPDTNDYGADLILYKNSEKIVVQAKRYKGKVGVHAIQEIIGAMHYYECNKAMVVTNSFFTPNAVNMANKCDVELWDRNTLKKQYKI